MLGHIPHPLSYEIIAFEARGKGRKLAIISVIRFFLRFSRIKSFVQLVFHERQLTLFIRSLLDKCGVVNKKTHVLLFVFLDHAGLLGICHVLNRILTPLLFTGRVTELKVSLEIPAILNGLLNGLDISIVELILNIGQH